MSYMHLDVRRLTDGINDASCMLFIYLQIKLYKKSNNKDTIKLSTDLERGETCTYFEHNLQWTKINISW